jgi:HEPN domain-containing protein
MNIDPQKTSDTRTWLVKALRDLVTAEQLFAFENPLLDSIVYYCHQAAEKALTRISILARYTFPQNTQFRRVARTICIYRSHAVFI